MTSSRYPVGSVVYVRDGDPRYNSKSEYQGRIGVITHHSKGGGVSYGLDFGDGACSWFDHDGLDLLAEDSLETHRFIHRKEDGERAPGRTKRCCVVIETDGNGQILGVRSEPA